jgi:Peptidase family M28/PA domain
VRGLPEEAARQAARVRRAAGLCAAVLAGAAIAVSCGDAEPDAPAQTPPTATTPTPAGPIAETDIREHLAALQRIADRNGGNRGAGRPGDRATSDYVARMLRAAGWTVRFQTVSFPFFQLRGRPTVQGLARGRDFSVLQYSGSGRVTGRVTAIDDQACTQAALAPVRRGDIAVVARGTCTFRVKARNAQRAGAAALVVVDREAGEPVRATLGDPEAVDIPVLAVSAGAGARLARARGRVTLRVQTISQRRRTRNVLAETPGAAPGGRFVMAGAHLDSVAAGPGINDNGSGIAALLEVAERLAGRPGLRLGFWGAEELGLHGSRRYVRGLDGRERRELIAYLNFDMVGSPRPRPQVYDTDNDAERALRRAFGGPEQEIRLGGASDHAPFQRAGIAVGGLFTGAGRRADPCYHRRCDGLDNVDLAMNAKMARAAQDAIVALRTAR